MTMLGTRIRALTRDMLAKANAGDWDAVVAIESDRRPLLPQVFGATVTPAAHAQYQTLIIEILSADQQIIRMAQQRRDELAGLLRQVGQGRAACQAYEGNSR